MKILAICGSPRKGNCEALLMEAAEGARAKGAEIKVILLRNIQFAGCCGRDQCYHEGECQQADGLTPILENITKCDGLILASPSYFNNVSGLMKNFMDRTNPYCKSQRWRGKKAVVIAVGGATKHSVRKCSKAMTDFISIHNIKLLKAGHFMAEKSEDAETSKAYMKKARELGKALAKS